MRSSTTERELGAAGSGIRLVVCDMDGTLLDDEKKISERSMEAIREARKEGILTTICSGRLYLMLDVYIKRLGLELPFISSNGAAIIDPIENRVLYQKPVPVDGARRLFSLCARMGFDYCALGPDGGFFSRGGKCIERFMAYNNIATAAGEREIPLHIFDGDHENGLRPPIHKILIYRLDDDGRACVKEFLENRRDLAYTFSDPTLVDVLAPEVDKGSGVRELARIMGVKKEEICVFGDYTNDIPMFREAGLAIAMENGCEEIRNLADVVTGPNNRDGVAQAFRKHLLRDGAVPF
ncbi:MAG: Cof-type HAD-IIB family hydrolase [Synergistaceae bacterium]|nr:Cof-type HAD-IIB family hydrolase [Synergistaceae bacterium]